MTEERTVMLVLTDQDGLDNTTTLIDIKTALPTDQVIPAIKAACQDFLATPEGRKQWEDNCHNFNYGDFDMYVGNEFCEPHGFTKIQEETFEAIDDDFNTTLAELDELSPLFKLDEPYSDVEVGMQEVDDIMESAMTGCTYWCSEAEVIDSYLGDYASEQISRGGEVIFHQFEEKEAPILDLEKFQKGLNMWIKEQDEETVQCVITEFGESKIVDPGQIDADAADSIIQYALFGELVYS